MHLPSAADHETRIALWTLLEDNQEELRTALLERIEAIPALAPLAAQAKSQPRDERGEALTRAALIEGRWEPYLQDLRERGQAYARMGISLDDWFALVQVYKVVMVPRVVARYPGQADRIVAVLQTLDSFVDRALRELGAAYMDESARALHEAHRRRELVERLFEASPLGFQLWQANGDGTFASVSVNPSILQMRKTSPLSASRTEELLAILYDRARHCIATGETPEWSITMPSGTILRVMLVKLDDTHVGQVVEDVTGLRRSTRQLERSVSELERSNRDLDQFAYVASHDLKAPLRDIDNLSRWLVEDLGAIVPPASAKHLSRLRDRVERMERLLDDLLEYSRAGRVNGPTHRFDLAQAIRSAVEMVGVPPGFEVVLPEGSLTVNSPRAPFELVVRNLVGNAIKHHDRGAGTIRIQFAADGPWVLVSVVDDGTGIPAEYRERVFEMFQTLKPRDQVEGSGMGLAIVRKVVDAFGGTIHIAPTEGRGTTMVFGWPLDQDGRKET